MTSSSSSSSSESRKPACCFEEGFRLLPIPANGLLRDREWPRGRGGLVVKCEGPLMGDGMWRGTFGMVSEALLRTLSWEERVDRSHR